MVVRFIINTTVHSGIGIAPAQLVFASHADSDRGILFEWATPDEQFANNPPARMNAFVTELFRIQAQDETQDAQHLATRQAAQIADPMEYRLVGGIYPRGKAITSCWNIVILC
jgi:hypothetical protein